MLACMATLIGFLFGGLFGFVAGCFWARFLGGPHRLGAVGARRERAALLARHGAGDHLLVVADVAAATGAGPGGSGEWAWDWAHIQSAAAPRSPCR